MLLNEFLKQHRKVEQQQAEIQELKEKAVQIESLEKRLNALEQMLRPGAVGSSGRLQMSAR
jgi:predicted RNase H-like nuclease (RuvC/YqgF family)